MLVVLPGTPPTHCAIRDGAAFEITPHSLAPTLHPRHLLVWTTRLGWRSSELKAGWVSGSPVSLLCRGLRTGVLLITPLPVVPGHSSGAEPAVLSSVRMRPSSGCRSTSEPWL